MEDVVDGGGGTGRMPVEQDVGIGGAGRMGTTATTGTTLSYDGGGVVDLLKKATLAAMLLVALVVVVEVVEVAVVSLPTAPVLVLTCRVTDGLISLSSFKFIIIIKIVH